MLPIHLLPFILPSITSKKIKTHFTSLLYDHLKPFLSKAKTALLNFLINKPSTPLAQLRIIFSRKTNNKNSRKAKSPFGSFRFHTNWCSSSSSHVMPVSPHTMKQARVFHFSTQKWADEEGGGSPSNYSDLVEEYEAVNSEAWNSPYEIDRRAEMFIAQNHAKFKLDKQHSYNKDKTMRF